MGNVKWKMERNGTYPNSSKCSPVCIGDFAILDGKNKNKIASFGFSAKVKMINERLALFSPRGIYYIPKVHVKRVSNAFKLSFER